MRLDFNVLWVDDQPMRVASQIEAIRKNMQEHAFEFLPTMCTSVAEVRASLADGVFKDEIDLILVDWDLGRDVQGQEVIALVRDEILYKDVVFYSALKPVVELRRLASDRGVEGVYCATRDDLVQEVSGVFDSLVKKVLDLDHVRGIVVSATSDMDHMVIECLTLMHSSHNAEGQTAMLKEAIERVQERLKDLTKQVEKLEKSIAFGDFLKAHMIFTANDRLRMLTRMLEHDVFKAHQRYKPSVDAYRENVVPDRNILSHQVLVPEGRPKMVVDNRGREISLEETRDLRRRLLDLRGDFRRLLQALRGTA
jgi:hypothetical protein